MFPIAVQAPPESNEDRNADFELMVEVAEVVLELVGKALLLPVRALTTLMSLVGNNDNALMELDRHADGEARRAAEREARRQMRARKSRRPGNETRAMRAEEMRSGRRDAAEMAARHNAQLAASSVTPYVVLSQLALAESDTVRNSLVSNEAIGCDILDRLALDNNRFIAAQARSRRDLVCNYSSRRVS